MNEETHEPLSAILAEMRDGIHTGRADIIDCVNDRLRSYADRIEAAYKREHAQWSGETNAAKDDRNRIACKMRYEFSAKCRACKSASPGNAAALREVLEKIRHEYCNGLISCRTGVSSEADVERVSRLFYEGIDAALAAPARNCDRYADATEMARAFLQDPYSTQGRDSLVEVAHRFAEWAFAPAGGCDHA